MPLYFITGNKNKFEQARTVILNLEMLSLDLKELQELDVEKIIKEKLAEAGKHHDGNFFVEDQSLHLDALGGLPGPFIKWFLQAMGVQGIFETVKKLGDNRAENEINIGYRGSDGQVHFFRSSVRGQIVEPKGGKDFGWGPIFKPNGSEKTYGEMSEEERAPYNPRIMAIESLRDFLAQEK